MNIDTGELYPDCDKTTLAKLEEKYGKEKIVQLIKAEVAELTEKEKKKMHVSGKTLRKIRKRIARIK